MNKKIENIINQINSSDTVILEGAISVLSALCSDNSRISAVILKNGIKYKNAQKILNAAKAKNVKTEFFSPEEFSELENIYPLGKTHGGIVSVASKRKFLSPEELIRSLPKFEKPLSIAIIEGIEDPYNLGCAARALYTQGTDALILPERDFGFSETVIEKASTGTFSKMQIAVFSKDAGAKTNLIGLLKRENFVIYCIDKKRSAASVFDVVFADRAVFIIGGEKRGISKDFVCSSDETVQIPYAKNFPHSIAAQTAATIVSYEIHRQRAKKIYKL